MSLIQTESLGGGTAGGGGGGTGSVTSVGLTATPTAIFNVSGSPVTTSGVLALSLDNQSAALFLAGPASGGAATPAFRAIGTSDLPVIPLDIGVTGLLGLSHLFPIPLDTGVTGILALSNLPSIPNSGLTGIIDLSHIPPIPFPTGLTNTAGIPFGITTQHGLTLSATQILDIGFAGISQIGVVGFSSYNFWNAKQAALPWTTAGDLVYLDLTGSPARLAIGLTTQVVGVNASLLPAWVVAATGSSGGTSFTVPLPVYQGGTGATLPSLANQDLIVGAGSTQLINMPIGVDGQVLTVVGSSLSWHRPFYHVVTTGVSSTPYAVTQGNRWLNVSSGVTAIVITMLSASMRIPLYIKDIGGTCSANNITVVPLGSELIENIGSTHVMQTDYGGRWFIPDGTNWWLA